MTPRSEVNTTGIAMAGVYELLADGDKISAVMVAEELMSDMSCLWYDSPTDLTACELIGAACSYVVALTAVERYREAYDVAIATLTLTADYDVEPAGVLALTLLVWRVVDKTLLAVAPPPDNSEAKDNVARMIGAFGALLYHAYYSAGNSNPDDPALDEAYNVLSEIMTYVRIEPTSATISRRILIDRLSGC